MACIQITNTASSQNCYTSGVGDIGAAQLSWVSRSSAHEGIVTKEVVFQILFSDSLYHFIHRVL